MAGVRRRARALINMETKNRLSTTLPFFIAGVLLYLGGGQDLSHKTANTSQQSNHSLLVSREDIESLIDDRIDSYMKNSNMNIKPPTAIGKFNTTAKKCQEQVKIQDSDYTSQSKEDRKLMQWFGNICEGSYIEIGALDGVTFSNSHVFNKALKWKGVMIELMKNNFDNLVENRKSEIATINAGVCDVPQTLHYTGHGAIGGIWEFSAPSFREQWWPGITLDSPSVHEIECDTLDSLLLKYAPANTFFDFFSLDVEGAEFAVVKSVDWKRTGFGIIFVEADQHNEFKNLAMMGLIESQGYKFLEEHERSYWFVNEHFHEIYKDLVY